MLLRSAFLIFVAAGEAMCMQEGTAQRGVVEDYVRFIDKGQLRSDVVVSPSDKEVFLREVRKVAGGSERRDVDAEVSLLLGSRIRKLMWADGVDGNVAEAESLVSVLSLINPEGASRYSDLLLLQKGVQPPRSMDGGAVLFPSSPAGEGGFWARAFSPSESSPSTVSVASMNGAGV